MFHRKVGERRGGERQRGRGGRRGKQRYTEAEEGEREKDRENWGKERSGSRIKELSCGQREP